MADTSETPVTPAAPVEMTPSPIEAFIEPTPGQALAAPEVPVPPAGSSLLDMFDPKETSSGSPAVPAVPAQAPAAATDADKVAELGKAYGLDLSRFGTEEAALSALSFLADQWANLGNNVPPMQDQYGFQQPQTPVLVPAAQATQFEFPKLDPTQVDPSVIAAFNTLKDRTENLQRELTTRATNEQQQTAVQFEAGKQQVISRASAAVDSLNSPKYGAAATRTEAQRIAVDNVMNEAGKIIMGMAKVGATPPPIEQVMRLAIARDKSWGPPATPATPATPAVPVNLPATPFVLPPNNPANTGVATGTRLPRISKQNDPFNLFQDPTAKAIFAEAMR